MSRVDINTAHVDDIPPSRPRGDSMVAGIGINNAGRAIDTSSGHTKLEVARYYEAISERALQHL